MRLLNRRPWHLCGGGRPEDPALLQLDGAGDTAAARQRNSLQFAAAGRDEPTCVFGFRVGGPRDRGSSKSGSRKRPSDARAGRIPPPRHRSGHQPEETAALFVVARQASSGARTWTSVRIARVRALSGSVSYFVDATDVASPLIASEPVQPLQRFLHRNLHQHGGRHLSAQCGRLTGPERCEIATALLLRRSAQRSQLTEG